MNKLNPYIVIVIFAVALYLDFIPLIKSGKRKEIWIYSIIILTSFTALMANSLGFDVPSPFLPIINVLEGLVQK